MVIRKRWLQSATVILILLTASLVGSANSLIWAISNAQAAAGAPASGDEFVGPFASWMSVKNGCVGGAAAKGDGTTDDTAAIQNCLNVVGTGSTGPIIWFPAGTYTITAQLTLANRQHVGLLGEDPATTTIKWAGPGSGGTMLLVSAVDYSRISRLTFNGANSAAVLIDQSAVAGGPGGFFDTGNEYADNVFQNGGIGYRCGYGANGCAESSLIRDRFTNLSQAGVFTGNQNALDIWIRYSVFDHCNFGVTNYLPTGGSGGNFRVYNSVFRYSTIADLNIGNTGLFSARGNYSIGSNRFINAGGSDNVNNFTIQGNTILDTVDPYSISIGNEGPVLLHDNVIRSLARGTFGVVFIAAFSNSDAIAIGNTFTVSSPIGVNGRLDEIGSSIVSAGSINAIEPTLPSTEQNYSRQVFDLASGASALTIQQAINNAVAQTGNRPVVHFPAGAYNINQTITIPANADVQLVGDGYNTSLNWSGSGAGPVLQITGPSKATLRDFTINGGNASAEGVVASNIDQSGSRVFMHGVQSRFSSQINIFADSLNNTAVELEDIIQSDQSAGGSYGLYVGGTKVNMYSGLSSSAQTPYYVTGGGQLVLRDAWYEGGAPTNYLKVSGSATATVDNNRVASFSPTAASFNISNLNGRASILNSFIAGNIAISGTGTFAQVLSGGVATEFVPTTPYLQNNASPAASAGLLASRQSVGGGDPCNCQSIPTANSGAVDSTFVTNMLAQTRAAVQRPIASLASGVTDLRMYRVGVVYATKNIHLIGSLNSPPPPTATLAASPATITSGQSSTLTWSSTKANSCTSTGFSTGNAISGSLTVVPPTTTTYSVACTGPGGSASASATVTVNSPRPLAIGSRVKTTAALTVRNKPTTGPSGKVRCTQPVGTLGTIVGGPNTGNGHTWWNVNFDTGCDGWVVQSYLNLVPPIR